MKALLVAVAFLLALPAFAQDQGAAVKIVRVGSRVVTNALPASVNGSTLAVVNAEGTALSVTCISGCSAGGGGNSGSYTVTPGTGTFLVNGSTMAIVNPSGQSLSVTFPSAQAVTQSGAWNVNGSTLAVVNPLGGSLSVSGPLTDAQLRAAAVPVSAAGLPLPSGAATGAKQDTGNASLANLETLLASSRVLQTASTGTYVNGSTVAVVGLNGAAVAVSAASLPLPSGAATESTVAGIKTGTDRIPAQGQALAAASLPVVLTAAQLATLTPPGAIAGFALEAGNLAIIKTNTDKIPTSPATDRATAGSPAAARLSDGAGFYKATTPSDTQPISAAALPLPSGAATESTLSSLNGKVTAVNTGAVVFNGAQPVTLPTAGSTFTVVGINGQPIMVTPSTATLKTAAFSITATGTLIAAVAGKRLRVYALSYISGGIASVNFRDGASTALEGVFAHAANSGRVENVNPPAFLFATTAGNSLDMVYSGAGTVAGRISYWEE